jgi:hypothetical protein
MRKKLLSLPEDVLIMILEIMKADKFSLCSLSRVNHVLHRLSLTLIYFSADLGALQTLLSRPDLAEMVQKAILTWWDWESGKQESRNTNVPIQLTDAQAMTYGIDPETRNGLQHTSLPDQSTLFLRVCPNVNAIYGTWHYHERFFSTQFPLTASPLLPLVHMRHLRALYIHNSDHFSNFEHAGLLDASAVIRLLLMPGVNTACLVYILDHASQWPSGIPDIIPNLIGTSSITHLTLASTAISAPKLQTLLSIPAALTSFVYQYLPVHTVDLSALAAALIASSSFASLERLKIFGVSPHIISIRDAVQPVGTLVRVRELPALHTLEVDAHSILGEIKTEEELDQQMHLLPHVELLSLRNLLDACANADLALKTASRIIEASGQGKWRTLDIELNNSWRDEDVAVIRALGSQYGVTIS